MFGAEKEAARTSLLPQVAPERRPAKPLLGPSGGCRARRDCGPRSRASNKGGGHIVRLGEMPSSRVYSFSRACVLRRRRRQGAPSPGAGTPSVPGIPAAAADTAPRVPGWPISGALPWPATVQLVPRAHPNPLAYRPCSPGILCPAGRASCPAKDCTRAAQLASGRNAGEKTPILSSPRWYVSDPGAQELAPRRLLEFGPEDRYRRRSGKPFDGQESGGARVL